jgi:hypothetical protein
VASLALRCTPPQVRTNCNGVRANGSVGTYTGTPEHAAYTGTPEHSDHLRLETEKEFKMYVHRHARTHSVHRYARTLRSFKTGDRKGIQDTAGSSR